METTKETVFYLPTRSRLAEYKSTLSITLLAATFTVGLVYRLLSKCVYLHSCVNVNKYKIFKMAFSKLNLLKNIKFSPNVVRNSSKISTNSTGAINLVDKIVELPDGTAYVSWHPDTDFPYECSRPIPNNEKSSSSFVLKEDAVNNAMQAFKSKNPEFARQELMRITHTTKHRWFPRARDKKAKTTPMDREYL